MVTIQTRYFLVQSWASKVSKGTQARDSLPNCPAIGPLGHAGTEPELRWQNYVPSSERKQTVQGLLGAPLPHPSSGHHSCLPQHNSNLKSESPGAAGEQKRQGVGCGGLSAGAWAQPGRHVLYQQLPGLPLPPQQKPLCPGPALPPSCLPHSSPSPP